MNESPVRRWRGLGPAFFAGLTLAFAADAAPARPRAIHGPYKDLTIAIDRDTLAMRTAVFGEPRPVLDVLPPGTVLTWAFATGECGAETWAGLDAQKVAEANVAAHVKAGVDYIVSTGGQGGVFTCASDDGMERFIARYASPRLVGIDFDIEAGQTDEQVDALVRRVKVAERRHPALRFSFTLATWAGTDRRRAGLNAHGARVLQTIRRHGLRRAVINLMVMNYGDAIPAHCVVADGRCDMGRSALQAARNLAQRWRVPLSRVALTAMVGVNDVTANVLMPDDARRVARDVERHGLAGLHFWSLDRDTPCRDGVRAAVPHCSGLADIPPLAYTRALQPR